MDQSRVADGHTVLVTHNLLGGEGESVPLAEGDLPALEGADAVLRALGVQHDGDGQVELLPDLLDEIDLLLLLGMGTVGEVQAGHVNARLTHGRKDLLRLAGRADGTDNLCFSHRMVSFITVSFL